MTERDVLKSMAYSLRISHASIGEKTGISQTQITRQLNGEIPLRADRLSGICDAIGAELCIIRGKKKYVIHYIEGEVVVEEWKS